jgi:hypothetical protein
MSVPAHLASPVSRSLIKSQEPKVFYVTPDSIRPIFCKSAERGELTWWARPTAEGRRPREKGNSHRGLAFPGSGGDVGGTPLTL